MTARKLTTKAIAISASTYIGKAGELFYDTVTATLKISNGTTPGGATLSTDGSGGGSVTLTNGAVIKDTAANAVAFGNAAGQTSQGGGAVAVGIEAGKTTQGDSAVAIGNIAGTTTQGTAAVAVGTAAGQTTQGAGAVAVGFGAGQTTQGAGAIAIGQAAGATAQGANSIILNASGAALNQTTASTFTVKPVRDGGAASGMSAAGFRPCYYNPTTGEFVYSSS